MFSLKRLQRQATVGDDPQRLCVAHALGCSLTDAAAVLRASARQNETFHADFANIADLAPDQVDAHVATVAFPDRDAFAHALTHRTRPLILVSAHMGNYLSGLLAVARAIPHEQLVILRRPQASERETLAYRHLDKTARQVRVLRLNERPLRAALRSLRPGNTLVAMFDVPSSFGVTATVPTPWLGATGHLPAGVAYLAVNSGALVLPVITRRSQIRGRQWQVECAPLLSADRACTREARGEASRQLSQRLAQRFERWIRAYPEDWMLWGQVARFWVEPKPT